MKKIIGIIASNEELKERIEYLYKEDVQSGNIIIDILNIDLIEEQGKILEAKGAQAIIGRGGGYNLVLDTVNIPVVPMNMKVIDLLRAINIAKSYSKEVILVVGYDEVDFCYNEWRDILNINIKEEWFKSKFEIRNIVRKYLDKRNDVVIIGSGIACSFAKQYKMDNVFIGASDDSIIESIDYCKNLLSTIEEERFNNEALRNILNGIKDGVIAIDTEGKIILYNESAQHMLRLKKEDVLNKHVTNVFPKMSWLIECLHTKKNLSREIRNLNGLAVNTRGIFLQSHSVAYGALAIIQDITKLQKLEKSIRIELNKKGLANKYSFDDFIYKDEVTKDFVEEVKKVASTNYTILLNGESGSGKEIIAQSMHSVSKRKNAPFIAINCASLSESLLESELFGYEEGSFTGAKKGGKVGLFELAHGGTVFLDEINSLPLSFQNKLLRVIEERQIMRIGSDHIIPIDIRIIAATNESLRKKVQSKEFRADLFYRLSSIEVDIPPIRDRKEDIELLFNYFVDVALEEVSEEYSKEALREVDIKRLKEYEWPGNVREIKNVAQTYVITGKIRLLNEELLIDNNVNDKIKNKERKEISNTEIKEVEKYEDENVLRECIINETNLENMNIDMKEINKNVEKVIIDMLFAQGLSKAQVCKILGISRTSLWKKYND